ncbi:MAG TPA: Fe-Mn family superoxide dismutase [Planctomycetota bacterium]|nr:Fe-Mn family superoxide dismutase [Planctomycetota bacterium]
MNRRDVLTTFTLGSAAMALPELHRQGAAGKPGSHEIKPLPFDPTKLRGLSDKLLVSHHDNNYGGAVKNLNKVEAELANVNKDTAPFLVAGLKERELTFRNSAALHEHYFGNLGGDGKPGGAVEQALAAAHGTLGRWEELFRATAMSLAGGSGWVVLAHDLYRDALVSCWSGGHTQNHAVGLPLLVLDMYEHAFHLDYGAAAAKYVDAFFANVKWEEVNRRFEAARKAAAAMRA